MQSAIEEYPAMPMNPEHVNTRAIELATAALARIESHERICSERQGQIVHKFDVVAERFDQITARFDDISAKLAAAQWWLIGILASILGFVLQQTVDWKHLLHGLGQ